MVVLHYTAMEDAPSALARLCDPEFEVSAHYLIDQTGAVFHLVREDMRAWHAGRGHWGDQSDINSASIGIELCNRGDHPFPEAQFESLCDVLRTTLRRWDIKPERVIGHSDMAPERKKDPGRYFDWQRLAARNLAVFRGHPQTQVLDFLKAAERFGYHIPDDKRAIEIVLEAFRQRFHPTAFGRISDEDVKIMSDLAQSYPVDQTDPAP